MHEHPNSAPAALAVCAIFKNEAPNLREWIEFHRLVGVERFFLYDNGSEDDWSEALHPYYASGVVQVVHWPGPNMQLSAYWHALASWGRLTRWMAFLDLDEFLFSPIGAAVPTVLKCYDGAAALGACWAVYGTGGVRERTGLVTESFRYRSTDWRLSCHVKSIVRTARAIGRPPYDPHHFAVDGPAIDELRRPLDGPFAQSPTYDFLRINHYVSKSETEARAKMTQPRADNGELRRMDLLDPALNERHDTSIMPIVARLRKRLAHA